MYLLSTGDGTLLHLLSKDHVMLCLNWRKLHQKLTPFLSYNYSLYMSHMMWSTPFLCSHTNILNTGVLQFLYVMIGDCYTACVHKQLFGHPPCNFNNIWHMEVLHPVLGWSLLCSVLPSLLSHCVTIHKAVIPSLGSFTNILHIIGCIT